MLRKLIASAGALALLLVVAVATPSGQGLRSDRAVYFTFSQPVALPGKTLPAGKYLFKLLDSPTTRTMVQVYNAEGTQQIAMFMTVPAERLDRPERCGSALHGSEREWAGGDSHLVVPG